MGDELPKHLPEEPDRDAATSVPAHESKHAVSAEVEGLEASIGPLLQRGRNGVNWFYWVGGLSLVNSVIMLTGGNTFFVVGLGVTLVFDAIATMVAQDNPNIGSVVKAVTFGLDVLAAAIVAGFGWLAGKRYMVVFAIGMALYFLDGLLFVWLQDWMSVAFHAFALLCMWGGFTAFRTLNAVERELRSQPASQVNSAPDEGH